MKHLHWAILYLHIFGLIVDLLLVTMRSTHNQEALQSLTLQREFHLKQEAFIRQKQQIALSSKKKAKKQRPLSGQDQLDNETRDPKVKLGVDMNTHTLECSQNQAETPIMRELGECEALVQSMSLSVENPGLKEDKTIKENQPKTTEADTPSQVKNVAALDELKGHLFTAKCHAINMLKDNELLQRQVQYYKCENEQLKEKLNRPERTYMEDSTDSEKYYPVPVGMNLHDLPSLELPPLEMPKFDFSAIKMDAENALD